MRCPRLAPPLPSTASLVLGPPCGGSRIRPGAAECVAIGHAASRLALSLDDQQPQAPRNWTRRFSGAKGSVPAIGRRLPKPASRSLRASIPQASIR